MTCHGRGCGRGGGYTAAPPSAEVVDESSRRTNVAEGDEVYVSIVDHPLDHLEFFGEGVFVLVGHD